MWAKRDSPSGTGQEYCNQKFWELKGKGGVSDYQAVVLEAGMSPLPLCGLVLAQHVRFKLKLSVKFTDWGTTHNPILLFSEGRHPPASSGRARPKAVVAYNVPIAYEVQHAASHVPPRWLPKWKCNLLYKGDVFSFENHHMALLTSRKPLCSLCVGVLVFSWVSRKTFSLLFSISYITLPTLAWWLYLYLTMVPLGSGGGKYVIYMFS